MKNTLFTVLGLALSVQLTSAQQFLQARPTSREALLRQAQSLAADAPAHRSTATVVQRPGRAVLYSYDDNTNTWADPAIYTYSYNAAANPTQVLAVDSATGTPQSRELTVYTAAGKVASVTNQFYVQGAWEDGYRYVYTYDDKQQLTEERTETTDLNGGWKIEEATRYLNTYNAANQLTVQTLQNYRAASQSFADSVRYQFTRNASGQWTERIEQNPTSTGWENDSRLYNASWFDFSRDLLLAADADIWTGSSWQVAGRLVGTYSSTRWELISQAFINSAYVNAQRQLRTFDAYGNPLSFQLNDWNGTAWTVFIGLSYQNIYNADNTIRRRITSLDFGSGPAPLTLENLSNYQSFVLANRVARAAGSTQAYPNPSADGRFTLVLPTATPAAELLVTDALGRTVAQDAWQGPARTSHTLNLAGQPAGLYLVTVRTAAGVLTQKVSIR